MWKVTFSLHNFFSINISFLAARKMIQQTVPIVHNDNDIELIINRFDQSVNNIMDMFIKSKLSIHILRAIEPNLRFGGSIKNYISKVANILPSCQYRNHTENSSKCIRLASRKQIGDALIKFEEYASFDQLH